MHSNDVLSGSRSPRRLDRTMSQVALWRRDVAERREARRIARQWQYVTDRQLRDIGLDRTAVLTAAGAAAGSRCRHE